MEEESKSPIRDRTLISEPDSILLSQDKSIVTESLLQDESSLARSVSDDSDCVDLDQSAGSGLLMQPVLPQYSYKLMHKKYEDNAIINDQL